jgi:UDP-N-acetylglucosamine/UDP-N-acetylgalactosamine diphosphorylase
LADQIREIDFSQIARLYAKRDETGDVQSLAERAEEPRSFTLGEENPTISSSKAAAAGAEALKAGKLAALVVAGGQGSRLGFAHPKGMYPIGPVSEATLFQIHIEKIRALAAQFGARVPLCVMTSPATHAETVAFLEENARFGLPLEDLLIFCQGTMPAVSLDEGKVLLAEKDAIALSPDGHGGTLAALSKSGVLDELSGRGIEQIFYFQVDNPLVDVGNPEFTGYHLLMESELTSQVVAKQSPLEKVGNVVRVDGHLQVIEYSDLPDEVAHRRRADGSLEIWAGSIAVHMFSLAFLARKASEAESLPFHVAKKKVPHVTESGEKVEPEAPNAIKFERFIFDLLPSAENAIVVEVDPAEHFAPLKNAPGSEKDSPEAVQAQLCDYYRNWLREVGAEVADEVPVEISPLFARDLEQLAEKVERGRVIDQPTYFHI